MATSFRSLSLQFNANLSKEIRKDEGIYFTPYTLRETLFSVLAAHNVQSNTILEPSFGSGEFIHDALERYPTAKIYGVEKNKVMFDAVQATHTNTNLLLENADFLTYPSSNKFHLIIGNPPYFVTDAKNPACMTGRGNIFVQFIYKCLTEHLEPNGVLAFVIPTSFYNCGYYQPCRDYIVKNTTILHLENLDGGFHDTEQDTMLMIVRNAAPPQNSPFVFTLHNTLYLSPNYKELADLTKTSATLKTLGFAVKTGDVVWNQHKDDLHDTEGTIVIYMSNIVNNTIVLNNFVKRGKKPIEKKQRIKSFKRPALKGPALLVARGYGNSEYKLSYALVPESLGEFYGENHVNVITATTEEAKNNFQRILTSLADERTSRFLKMFIGNNALSKTELESILPIF